MRSSESIKRKAVTIISYLFILLFVYASVSKLFDFENFQIQISQSPILSAYAKIISVAVITVELMLSGLLLFDRTRLAALYGSVSIMTSFSIYIYLILNFSDFIPCSCGGVLEKLGWKEHLVFNIIYVALGLFGVTILELQKGNRAVSVWAKSAIMIAFATIPLTILFYTSQYIGTKENNFTRKYLTDFVVRDKTIILDNSYYYFAGINKDNLYLGNIAHPQVLTVLSIVSGEMDDIKIIPDNTGYEFHNLRIQVRPPYYYFFDGTVPVIFQGKLGESTVKTISLHDTYFTQMVVLDSASFAVRTQSSKNNQFTIGALNLNKKPRLELKTSVIQKQIDGVFDSDGKLILDAYNSELVYIYNYRNEFIVMNENLNVLRRLNTIDSTCLAEISTTRLADGTHKMSAPPQVVNNLAAVNGNLLYNQSEIKGTGESSEAWSDSKVIDMYRTDQNGYLGSFRLTGTGQNKVADLLATGDHFFVLTGNKIIKYDFNQL